MEPLVLEHLPQRIAHAASRRLDIRLVAVAMAGFCAFLDLYAPQPLLPTLSGAFGVDPARSSLAVGATTLGVALAAPFMGLLGDRIGRRHLIVLSLFGIALPTLLCGASADLGQLVFWRFLTGISMPGVIASVMAYVSEEWTEGAPRAMATYVTSSVLGGFVGRLVSGLLGEHAGWRAAFFALGGLTLAGAFAVNRWLPASRRFSPQSDWRRSVRDMGHHLRNPQLLATYAVGFSVLFSLVATFTWATFHLAEAPYRLSPAAQGSVFFVYLLGLVVTPASGAWIERFGASESVLAAVAVSAAGVALTLTGPLWAVVAGLALCSTGVFVCQSAASLFVGRAADRSRSVAAGLYVAFYYAGGSAGASLPGLLWGHYGWAGCAFLVLAVQVVSAAIVGFAWREPRRADTPVIATA